MSTAYAYASGQNIGKQFEIIQAYSKENHIKLLNQYFDSGNDDTQNKFNKMIKDLFQFPPKYIIVCDEAKISKDQEMLNQFKNHLSQYDVKLIAIEGLEERPKSNPVLGQYFEIEPKILDKVEFKKHETHHHLFGYRSLKLDEGKYVWELEENNAALLRKIALDLYCELNYSYSEIQEWLNDNHYKTIRGKDWTVSSVVNLFTEDKLEIYVGKAGDKPIFTREEYEMILSTKKYNSNTAVYGRTKKSTYLLTGLNLVAQPMFRCKHCGHNVIGYKNSSGKWSKYVCSKFRSEGITTCKNDWYIEQKRLEEAIWAIIRQYYTDPKNLERYKMEMAIVVKENKDLISKNSKLLIQNIGKSLVKIEDLLELVREAEWDEKREIVRVFLKTLEMDAEKGVVYLNFYGCGKVKIQF